MNTKVSRRSMLKWAAGLTGAVAVGAIAEYSSTQLTSNKLSASGTLSLWNDTPTRQAIMDFVATVTDPKNSNFVLAVDRIATFDNDGTLWLEKPMYIQFYHLIDQIGVVAASSPILRSQQPYKAVYENDQAWFDQAATDLSKGDPTKLKLIIEGGLEAFDGMTIDEFNSNAYDFLTNTINPHYNLPYKQLTYKPMVELIHYLQSNGFGVYITSGGGRDFIRSVSEEIYNIARPNVIGSDIEYKYTVDNQGKPQVVRTTEVEQPIDDKSGKPIHIGRTIGRRPTFAAGNTDGDIEMLQYAKSHTGLSLGLLVHHDDANREYAYDNGAEKALQEASESDWLVTSMRNDWKQIF
jgi:phosphoglycolate phosphatase-like HAD superfamily hydrolase